MGMTFFDRWRAPPRDPLLSVSSSPSLSGSPSHALNGTHNATTNSYYAQRAAAGGLIISEATNICPGAQGERA